jgi:hypothetical protein
LEEGSKNDDTLPELSLALNKQNEESYPQEKKFHRFIRTKGVYIAMISTTLGLFIGIPLLFWLASVTLISIGTIMLLIFGCGALGLIQWNYVKAYLDMEYYQFSMYAFAGFGMCFINLILLCNYMVLVNIYSEAYAVSGIEYNNKRYEVRLAGDDNNTLERGLNTYLKDHSEFIHIDDDPQFVLQPKTITVTFDTGLFGFDIIRECKFD